MDELDDAFRSHLSERVTFEHHPERADTPWKMKIEVEPPAYFSIIIGEAVQSMRTALDYLVYQLAVHARDGRKPRTKTQFPISSSAAKYFKRGRHQVRELLGEHRRRIRKLQPYQSSDPAVHPLAVLNRLSNTDKHRLLLTIVHQIGGISANLKVEDGRPVLVGANARALPSYLQGTKALEEIKRGDPDLGGIVWFDLGLVEEDAPVIATLNHVLGPVSDIIDSFVPVFGKE